MSFTGTPRRPGVLSALSALVLILAAATADPAAARQDTATLGGRVIGPDGLPVPAARVVASREEGALRRETRTAVDGTFLLEDLPPGSWALRVESAGFGVWRQVAGLGAGDFLHLSVRLEVAEVRQEIVVTSELPEFGSRVALEGERLAETATEDVARSLRAEAGLAAFRRGPINLDPTVRGLQEAQVAVFVDGTRTFRAGPGGMDSDLSHVGPHAVETVRVVKGPYALTWGAGTLAALEVETFTPRLGGPFTVAGRAGAGYGGNAGSRDAHAAVFGGGDRFAFSLLAGSRRGDDYEDGAGRTVPGDYTSGEARWSLLGRLGESTEVRYSGGYQGQDDIDYPGSLLDATFFKTRSHALEMRWLPPDSGVSELRAQLYANRKDHRMNNDEKPTGRPMPGRVPPFALDVDLETESNTAGGKLSVGLGQGPLRWKLGGDVYRTEQTADRVISRRADGRVLFEDVVWPDARLDDLGLYGQLVWERGGRQIGGTVRVDRYAASAGRPSDFFLANTGGDLERDDLEVSAAVSGRWRLGPGWIFTAGAGRAVRHPTALELYSDRLPSTRFQLPAEFLGNPELAPETSLELGLGSELRAGGVTLSVDLFHRRIDDYITVEPAPGVPPRLPMSPPVVMRYVNGTEARFWGGELELWQALGRGFRGLSWHGSLSYTRGEDELFDEPVLGVPPPTARFELRWEPAAGRWWTELGVTVAGSQERVAANRFELPTPGYTVLDLRGGRRLRGGWELRAGVENLGDKEYADHLNAKNPFTGERISERGRNLYLGMGVDF